jgi:hypothetical protein
MDLLTKKKAAGYLCVSAEKLMAEYHAGRVIAFKIGGQGRFGKRDLDEYVKTMRDTAALAARAKSGYRAGEKKIIPLRGAASNAGPRRDRIWTPGKRIEDACTPLRK